jgi:hypothetical protein
VRRWSAREQRQGETVGSMAGMASWRTETTNERIGEGAPRRRTIDGIDHPTRVQQTGHNEQSWRTVMTLSGIVKSGVGSGFPERPPRWLGKVKWRRQTDGCKVGLGRDASGRAMCCPNAAGGIILEGSYTDKGSAVKQYLTLACAFFLDCSRPNPLTARKGRWLLCPNTQKEIFDWPEMRDLKAFEHPLGENR